MSAREVQEARQRYGEIRARVVGQAMNWALVRGTPLEGRRADELQTGVQALMAAGEVLHEAESAAAARRQRRAGR